MMKTFAFAFLIAAVAACTPPGAPSVGGTPIGPDASVLGQAAQPITLAQATALALAETVPDPVDAGIPRRARTVRDELGVAKIGWSSPSLLHGAGGFRDWIVSANPFPFLAPAIPCPPGFPGCTIPNGLVAWDRITGQRYEGMFPAPSFGWVIPFSLRAFTRDGQDRVAVVDPGGISADSTDPESVIHSPRIVEYAVSFDRNRTPAVQATIVRQIQLTQAQIQTGYTSDILIAPNGDYVLLDGVLGQVVIVDYVTGVARAALRPQQFSVGPNPELTPGRIPQIDRGVVPEALRPQVQFAAHPRTILFAFQANYAPGINYGEFSPDGQYLYWISDSDNAGIYRIPTAALYDSRQPWERASSIQTVSQPPPGVLQFYGGLTFDRYNPSSPYLYVGELARGGIARINTVTGSREIVVEDPVMFNVPVSLAIAPPRFFGDRSMLVVCSDQEGGFPGNNMLIPPDPVTGFPPAIFTPPWLCAGVYLAN